MKIESIKIKNFRTYADQTIHLNDYTCFVGSNGTGKSTILNALNVFFRQYTDSRTDLSKLCVNDFHHKNIKEPIEITVTFTDLSAQAKIDLADYVRLDKLIITARAEYDEGTERAEVTQYGNRLGIEDFREWFDAEKTKQPSAELKKIFAKLRNIWEGIDNASSKADMATALRAFEAKNPLRCTLIPSEDQFYGISRGVNRLAPHIQWIFISAAKDAATEGEETKTSALGQLLARAVRTKVDFSEKLCTLRELLQTEYSKMLTKEQSALEALSTSVQEKLQMWATPNASAKLEWRHDPEKSLKIEEPFASVRLGERGFEGEIARFGHGMQRSYMLALLQLLKEVGGTDEPVLIMGVEEPELYQHPPQARHLSDALQDLSQNSSQIIVCSHSPYFIPGDNFESVRIVRDTGEPAASIVEHLTYSDLSQRLHNVGEKYIKASGTAAKLHPLLRPELSEMFFCRNLILVEGLEDVAHITTYVHLLDKETQFRRGGFHIVPVHGKSELIRPIAIAKLLRIPVFVVCDADSDKTSPREIDRHRTDNTKILKLMGYENEFPVFPEQTAAKQDFRMWSTNLTNTVISEIGSNYRIYADQAAAQYDNAGGLGKNPLAVSATLEIAWENGDRSDSLIKLVSDILAMVKNEVPMRANTTNTITPAIASSSDTYAAHA